MKTQTTSLSSIAAANHPTANQNVIEQFHDAIRAAGFTPPDRVVADGNLHRFSSNSKPRDDAGWYVLHGGKFPAGRKITGNRRRIWLYADLDRVIAGSAS